LKSVKETLSEAAPLALLAVVILASYSFARPTCEALFIESYGSQAFPWAWLAVAVFAVLASALYARAASRHPLDRVLRGGALLSAGVLALLLSAHAFEVPGAAFALYVWKDIYIVVVLETFWAIANARFGLGQARWLYGFFLLAGTGGSMLGNLGLRALMPQLGTLGVLQAVLPILLIVAGLGGWAPVRTGLTTAYASAGPRPTFHAQLSRLGASRYLQLLLTVVAVIQVGVTLVDAVWTRSLEQAFPTLDARTEAIGLVYLYTDVLSATLQLAAGPIVRLIGVPGVLLLVPALVAVSLGVYLASASYVAIAAAKVVGKACDYSLFRAAKELLYIPLDYTEKTEGKGLVDILGYRVAKGAASGILLALTAAGLLGATGYLAAALVVLWLMVTLPLIAAFRRRATAGE